MDFLNSLDLDQTNRKSRRMRSWYLYEQYKSLEKNQLYASDRQNERSYQEKILRQELSERKTRRKLYDRFGVSQSEPKIERDIKSAGAKSNLTANSDDFFESFWKLQNDDEEILTEVTDHDTSEDTFSFDDSITPKPIAEDFNSYEEHTDDNSCAESVQSVVEHLDSQRQLADELQKKLADEVAKIETAENMTSQLGKVKEDCLCLEDFASLSDEDEIVETYEEPEKLNKVVQIKSNVNLHGRDTVPTMWTRLVSFAYQVIQLNHGNCYYDYSSQFLTAVLACDVLRRGVSCMCDILQPYVSPIRYTTDESDASTDSYKNKKRKKSPQSKKCKKTHHYKLPTINQSKSSNKRCICKKYSEDYWRNCSKYTNENSKNEKKLRIASEPWRSVAKFSAPKKDCKRSPSSSIWPDFSNESSTNVSKYHCNCCHKRVSNPMLKISRYIDSLMQDINERNNCEILVCH